MRQVKVKLNDVLHIEILDHCKGSHPIPGPMVFDVYGKVVEIGNDHITLAYWLSKEKDDPNTELLVILKSAITGLRKLK